ncbi:hypothetical protein D3C81_1592500 [compost metagenome]
MREHECHRAFGAHVAAMLGERVAHFGHGSGAVVGQAVDDDGRAGQAVAFVADLFVVGAFQAAHAALDRALDVVLGHVRVHGLVDRQAQARVGVGIAAAKLGGHGDFLDQAGPDLAALGVSGGFLVFDIGPFRVTGHDALRGGKGVMR